MNSKAKFRYSFFKKIHLIKILNVLKFNNFSIIFFIFLDKPIQHVIFQSFINNDFHFHEVEEHKIVNEGFEKITKIAEGETVYKLKTIKQNCLLGLKLNKIFYILGFDPKHKIY